MNEGLIPDNKEGISTDTETSVDFATDEEAAAFFKVAKHRLLQVNKWHERAGRGTARFQLTDAEGREISRIPTTGDHFRIDIPAPGTRTGDGYDWVRVEAVEEDQNSLAIRVRPCPNPSNDDPGIAHFFSEKATSSFVVKKEGRQVIAGVYGRNEKPNTDAGNLADKIRNAAVTAGAAIGFSKIQWKALVNGLVEKEKED